MSAVSTHGAGVAVSFHLLKGKPAPFPCPTLTLVGAVAGSEWIGAAR